MKYCIVVPWHNNEQIDRFVAAWDAPTDPPADWLIFQQDIHKEGCAVTKNKGIEEALQRGAEVVIVLDDDCYLCSDTFYDYYTLSEYYKRPLLEQFARCYLEALEPKSVELYKSVTEPPSRGTPYLNRTVTMPVAASMGYWRGNPDFDAATQLVKGAECCASHHRKTMFWRFFPFSGMNCAFRAEFWPFFKFDETADRFDDIFMGYRLQAEAYRRGYCINLNGPMVRHVRQSNVWKNLQVEAENMERNETEWQQYVPKPT